MAQWFSLCFKPHVLLWANVVMIDARQRRIGDANKQNMQQALDALALYPFTQRLGMNVAAANDLINRARADAANASLKAYFPL